MQRLRRPIEAILRPIALRLPLSPHAVTTTALLLNLVAAALLFRAARMPALFLVAIAFLAIGGIADLLDGLVARERGETSRLGDFLDHFFDRVSDLALIAAWGFGSGTRPVIIAIAVVMVSLNGYIGTQLEATFHSRSYRGTGRAEFVVAMVVYPIVAFVLAGRGRLDDVWLRLAIADWMTVVIAFFAFVGVVQRFLEGLRLARMEGGRS